MNSDTDVITAYGADAFGGLFWAALPFFVICLAGIIGFVVLFARVKMPKRNKEKK